MRKVFICSPYSGDTKRNVQIAKDMCRIAILRGTAPFAPHLLYPSILDDGDPDERYLGMQAGLAYLRICEEVNIPAGLPISQGMAVEMAEARGLKIPIVAVDGPWRGYWDNPTPRDRGTA